MKKFNFSPFCFSSQKVDHTAEKKKNQSIISKMFFSPRKERGGIYLPEDIRYIWWTFTWLQATYLKIENTFDNNNKNLVVQVDFCALYINYKHEYY